MTSAKVLRRRSAGIRAYVGANGHGKTLAAVTDLLPSLDKGRKVLSNVRLLDYNDPRPCDDDTCLARNHSTHMAAHPGFVALTDFRQLLDWREGDVLLDEIAGVASSRESSQLPVQVVNMLQQLRRSDITLAWTAPSWARADKVLREVTQLVVHCKGYRPKKHKTEDRLWSDRRLFKWSAYDATVFEEFTLGKRDKIRAKPIQLFHRPGSRSERAYDTYDQVTGLGWAMESGMCMACGGRRSIPRCSCPNEAGSAPTGGRAHLASVGHRPTRAERREKAL